MRIEYKILWVEDVESWYTESKGLLEDFLKDLGFVIVPKLCKNFEEVEEEYNQNQLKEYDIVFVDFKLAGSKDGDVIIDFIRKQDNNSILTDIIFYSSDIESVRDRLKEFGFEGVYTSPRNEFTDKAEKVIKNTIKKVQELNSMRGLIMAETSDLDQLMLEILEASLNSDISKEIEAYVSKKMLDTAKDNLDKVKADNGTLNKIRSRVFLSVHKAKAIGEICKKRKIKLNELDSELYKESESFYQKYYQMVISPRNMFGHVKEIEKDGKKVLVSTQTGEEEVFNEERCIELRKILIRYREILTSIKDSL